MADKNNCIASTHPEFVKLFWNKEDTYKYTYGTHKKTDFKCPNCKSKVENKSIANVYRNGKMKVPCPCNDNISYPEKFIYSLLSQFNINFEFQKKFKWAKDNNTNGYKTYDFYLVDFNIIIETHGMQHFDYGFKKLGGRTLEEEKINDNEKRILAINNGINNYIVLNCKKSEMEFITNNIKDSLLNNFFDFSNIDWFKCHEFACTSFVKKACDLWERKKSIKEICEELKLTKITVRRYLKQGEKLNFCNYNAIEERKKSSKKGANKRGKKVIQIFPNGTIREWNSLNEVERVLGISHANISKVCTGEYKSAGGFKWAFKNENIS